jgi:hypothetical protein
MFKIIKKIIKKIMDMLMKNKKMIGILLVIIVIIVMGMKIMKMRKVTEEEFKSVELIVPPLELSGCEEYAWGCKINGYNIEPLQIYKCLLEGKSNKTIQYIKYKIIDNDNVVRYSGLFKEIEGLQVGSYITFDNGQELIITSLDTNMPPQGCPTVRQK